MSRLTVYSVRNFNSKNISLILSLFMVTILGGCSLELPNDTESGSELTLASRINGVAAAPRAVWDDNQITIRGAGISSGVAILNASTGQFIGAAVAGDDHDDDDDGGGGGTAPLILSDVSAIPCTISVQIGQRTFDIPLRNAPANCVGVNNSPLNSSLVVTKAKWTASTNKLTVKGDGALPRQLVSVFDSVTGHLLGTDQSNAVGKWKIKARDLLASPCLVSVVAGDHTIESAVTNAPVSCVGVSSPQSANFNQAPDGAIIGPIADMAISVGSSVNFIGTGFDPDSNTNLSYTWDFDFSNRSDAAGYSLDPNPTVSFFLPGVYRVSLTVTDSLGLADPTPDTRVIVVQPNVGISQPPSGVIESPANNVSVNAGTFVNFSGSGIDLDGSINSYIWNFAGGAINSSVQNPGNVMFSTPGVYLVSLTVIDNSGLADPTPQFVAVTVRGGNTGTPNSPTNRAPDGEITSPPTDALVRVGDSLDFMATAFDADGNTPLNYRWDFGGLRTASTELNPGRILFNQVGVYQVRFTTVDALGMSDLSPSVRIITVTDSGQNSNIAPESAIVLPSTNMTITAGQSVNFMGSGNDVDNNHPLSFSWNFGGAATPSIQQNPGAIIFSQAGTYNVSMTVIDSLGNADVTPAMRIITVLPFNSPGSDPIGVVINLPPESSINTPATNMVINVGQTVDFTGIGSDPENNSPLSYVWTFDGAAPENMVQNPGSVMFRTAGSYRVQLLVKDSMGNVDPTPAERIITVNNPFIFNTEPEGVITAPVLSETIDLGGSVNFASFGSDSDGSVVSYQWDFGGGALNSMLQNPGNVIFNEEGIFKITLYVKDNAGYYDSVPEVRFVTVINTNNVNQAPNSKIVGPVSDITVNIGDTVMFSGAGEDSDNFGSRLTYIWNFGGAAPNSSQAAPGLIQFNQAGTYNVSLSVMDNFGLTDLSPAMRKITVVDNSAANDVPVVTIATAALRPNINVGEALVFFASATDSSSAGFGQLSYFWDFDGAAANSQLQSPGQIMFDNAGIYKISVYVRDALNLRSAVSTYTVTVGPTSISIAPNGLIITPTEATTIMLGDTINFIGSATDSDTTNSLITYRWNFDGIAASSFSQNPGNVTFDKVGTFNVALTVADNTGATDVSPAVRQITVVPHNIGGFPGAGAGGGIGNGLAPNGRISTPLAPLVNIAAGGSANFSASATDDDGNFPIAYRWSFGNGLPDSFVQNPGVIVFNNPGIYTVVLTVTDSLGVVDTSPDVRTIIVGNGNGNVGGNVNAPNGVINMPSSAVTITRGQSVYFSGNATDPNSNASINYVWDFDGGAPNSLQQIPGDIIFSTVGQYTVSLTVTNGAGIVDQSSMIRTITVLP